jgi:hypothetical protein
LRTVFLARLVALAISRTDFFSRWCIRKTLPIITMVITHTPPSCGYLGQGRLNTWVKFGSAGPSRVGQISVGANTQQTTTETNYQHFIAELTALTRKYGVAIQSVGGDPGRHAGRIQQGQLPGRYHQRRPLPRFPEG